ncbi:hypothetical protein JET14_04630 [Martelella lutilitoris]|uniref:Uncharacterized protein n=1 Tax=Martelella lutilitoris TaxID=2583532 RepID=A0A7T7HLQ0_9HYPH|nr:hypothetical protein [Martelella lutilitoris]QQM31462.1 hypothetical protein JET14_04630 [Martelella lutilitoris]
MANDRNVAAFPPSEKNIATRFNHVFVKFLISEGVIALGAAQESERPAAKAAILQKNIVCVFLVAHGPAFTFDHEK